ncbi:hypothetical protein B296_00035677 [Ensete ventricosum]|uniref:Uncharacterized protein n=1 Tax=Ensete ventricosum TaxID=4639 RepID=A0A426Z8W8_ENSVE|nr:hypothetical protein B296_00035677 [Ensete ventricosum]
MIPVTHLHHPLLVDLLDKAHHQSAGPLRLPCSVDDFLHIRWLIGHQSSADSLVACPVHTCPFYYSRSSHNCKAAL